MRGAGEGGRIQEQITKRTKRGGQDPRADDHENQEWIPKWQGHIGKRSWWKGIKAPGLERFKVGYRIAQRSYRY